MSPVGLCLKKSEFGSKPKFFASKLNFFCFLKPRDVKPKPYNLESPVVLSFGMLMALDSVPGCVSFRGRASYLGLAHSRPLW